MHDSNERLYCMFHDLIGDTLRHGVWFAGKNAFYYPFIIPGLNDIRYGNPSSQSEMLKTNQTKYAAGNVGLFCSHTLLRLVQDSEG